MIYIFDLDGTLCDISHRLHFIESSPQDWSAFFKACVNDQPIEEVIYVLCALREAGADIALITGRSDEVRRDTVDWLIKHDIRFEHLLMRRALDHRQDSVVKSELLDELNKVTGHAVHGVFEDRQQVVDMYRARGLRVFQVAEGKF